MKDLDARAAAIARSRRREPAPDAPAVGVVSRAARENEGRRRWLARVPPHMRPGIVNKLMTLELARQREDVLTARFRSVRRRDPAAAARLLRDAEMFGAVHTAAVRADAKAALRLLERWDHALGGVR